MSHLSDDDLVLVHYGEDAGVGAVAHVRDCAACAARLAALGAELAGLDLGPAPSRPPGYGADVWARVESRLAAEGAPARVLRPFGRRPWGRVSGLLALAAALVIAFLAGRRFPAPGTPIAPEVRERILLVAVGDHLERSQLVLVELVNAPPDAPLDVASRRASADELVAANRLYRQTAVRAGEAGLAAVLEELERVLLEVATGPERLPPADLGELQRRIEARGLLFKIRVLGAQVRERGAPPSAPETS
jgi:hypothetical protein